MKKNYTVYFTYGIPVKAVNKEEAEAEAIEKWDNICPRTDEMNISVEEDRN